MRVKLASLSSIKAKDNGVGMAAPRKSLYVRLFAWWYLCLGLAFAALAWRNALLGQPRLGVVLRCAIAAGFFALGVITLRSASSRRR
jgi:hypothetical protein